MRAAACGLGALLWLASVPTGAQDAQPEEAAVADVQASEQATHDELAALGVDLDEEGIDTDLHLSGFMDVNVFAFRNPREAPLNALVYGDKPTILVGHLNVYLTKNITDAFSMMAELRFVYSPNGSQQGGTANLNTTYSQVLDYAGSGSYFRWGGIVVERAYGQWSPASYFSLRLGAFLTPYGIWNVDHGSPVFIPVTRPFAISGNFFPERQTGFEAFGRLNLTADLTMRYHLTLSNGLGPVSEYRDLDDNKAIGGRLVLEYLKLGTLQVGSSVFYGQSSSGDFGFGISDDASKVTLTKIITEQSQIRAIAVDLMWKYRGFHFQGEWVSQDVRYAESGRVRVPAAGQVGIPVNAFAADAFNWAGYALVGYRLPWWGVMPFATLEHQRSTTYGIDTRTSFSKVGLNVRPADAIVVKAEYEFAFNGTPGTEVKVIAGQVAWAF